MCVASSNKHPSPMSSLNNDLISTLENTLAKLAEARKTFLPRLAAEEVGTVTTISSGIATVSGLPSVGYDELVEFPGNLYGIAFNLDETSELVRQHFSRFYSHVYSQFRGVCQAVVWA
jgi:hypothetical protein